MTNEEKNTPARPNTTQKRNNLLQQITGYVRSNLSCRITLQQAASHCGVSISTVTQLFQKKVGITFHQYVTRCRMEAARQLISSGIPLEEVGRRVGYTDHSTFYRAFRQTFGVSPREYRRNLERTQEKELRAGMELL